MKKPILVIIILCISIASFAQSNGYMGLNVGLKYSTSLPGGIFDPKYKFVVGHDAELEFAFKKNWSVVGLYEFFKTQVTDFNKYEDRDFEGEFKTYNNVLNYKSHKIGFSFRRYPQKRGAIAPLGSYFGFGAGVILPKAISNYERFSSNSEETSNTTYVDDYIDVYLGLEAGRQYVVFNRMLIDIGMRVHLPLLTMYSKENFSSAPLSTNVFQVHVGIGSLLW